MPSYFGTNQKIIRPKPKYKAFAWKDYIKGRVEDNYSDLGEDDIQIKRFRIT